MASSFAMVPSDNVLLKEVLEKNNFSNDKNETIIEESKIFIEKYGEDLASESIDYNYDPQAVISAGVLITAIIAIVTSGTAAVHLELIRVGENHYYETGGNDFIFNNFTVSEIVDIHWSGMSFFQKASFFGSKTLYEQYLSRVYTGYHRAANSLALESSAIEVEFSY